MKGTKNRKNFIILPFRSRDVARIEKMSKEMSKEMLKEFSISNYWRKRLDDFSITYNKDGGFVILNGYQSSSISIDEQHQCKYVGFFEFLRFRGDYFLSQVKKVIYGYKGVSGEKKYNLLVNKFRERYEARVFNDFPLFATQVSVYEWFKVYENFHIIKDLNRKFDSVLEIGSGTCILPALLKKKGVVEKYTAIDLPFFIPHGFLILNHLTDNKKICLPSELDMNCWFKFLSSDDYKDSIKPNSIDLVINITSFGEMNIKQVQDYFLFIDSVLKPGGVFVCINREKKKVNFDQYPWPNHGYKTVREFEPFYSRCGSNKIFRYPIFSRIIEKM